MSVLGAQVFQVQKWPAGGFDSDAERRRAMRRPPLTLAHADAIREQVESVDLVGSELWDFGFKVEYKGESHQPERLHLRRHAGVSAQQHPLRRPGTEPLADGRAGRAARSPSSAMRSRRSCSRSSTRSGKEVRLDGRKYEVVGVFDEKKSAFGGNFDNYVLIPVTTFLDIYGMVDRDGFPRSVNITVRAKTPALIDDAIEETRQVLRRERGVQAGRGGQLRLLQQREPDHAVQPHERGGQARRLRHRHHRAGRGGHRHHEHHAGGGHRAHPGDRHPQGARRHAREHPDASSCWRPSSSATSAAWSASWSGFGLGNLVTVFTHFEAQRARWSGR